ncbi:unnamed protein product [Closterium sp. Naga37s-1]|nr:unnamed protein product [Closterium sp. Naga37s-1]
MEVARGSSAALRGQLADMGFREAESIVGSRSGGEGRDQQSAMVLAAVAESIEMLRTAGSDADEKERVAMQLSQLAETSVDARAAIGYHAQAIPLLVGLVRSGTLPARTHAAATLGAICDEQELRVKVLLGGCIPPMLALLRNGPKDSQMVAAEALFAMSKAGSGRDAVGSRIFASEGVVPALLQQLQKHAGIHPDVLGLVTGAMRNLCYAVPGFWRTVEAAGGVEIFTSMLSMGRPATQENAAALLTSFLTSPYLAHPNAAAAAAAQQQAKGKSPAATVAAAAAAAAAAAMEGGEGLEEAANAAARVVEAGAIPPLLALLQPGREVAVRTEAAGALRAISAVHVAAREKIAAAGGVGMLIRATMAPSAEMMQTGYAQVLQENAMGALANIAGGKAEVVASLAAAVSSAHSDRELADNIGALAYALMVLDDGDDDDGAAEDGDGGEGGSGSKVDAEGIERALVEKLSPLRPASAVVQERSIEALASLYGNSAVARGLSNAEGKRMLVGLVTLSPADAQAELVEALFNVCVQGAPLWSALHGREGVLQLVGLLGLSTEDQQECACALLAILSHEEDESKWAITAAGGIPPLVSLLGTGTAKAKEDAAELLGNLCSYNEDIRACVETADAAPALLHLLGSGSERGQAAAARALMRLVSGGSSGASSAIGQLTGILVAEVPESKVHVLRVLGQLLADSPDAADDGTAANEALQTLVALVESEREETQESAAAVLANLFAAREDLREGPVAAEAIPPLVRLVEDGGEPVAMQAARALAALFCSIDSNEEAAHAARASIFPLVKLARAREMAVAEVATTALANLLANPELALMAPADEVVLPLSRLLREGTPHGKEHAAGALAHLLHSRALDEELAESIRQCSTVLALVALLAVGASEDASMAALEALAALARAKAHNWGGQAPLAVLSEVPYSMGPLVAVLAGGTAGMQEKAVEVLSRLCKDQPVTLGDMIAGTDNCVAALTARITDAESLEVKVGGTALLICAAKEHRAATMAAMEAAGTLQPVVRCLVDMLAAQQQSRDQQQQQQGAEEGDGEASAEALVSSVALWLLAVMASHDHPTRALVAAAGAVDVLVDRLSALSAEGEEADDLGMDGDGGEGGDSGGAWVCALLLAVLFCNRDVVRSPVALRAIPPLASLLTSPDPSQRYFASQAVASLVASGSRGTLLAIANSGAIPLLLALLGRAEADVAHLRALADDFELAGSPEQVALEKLFRCDDIRAGRHGSVVVPQLIALLTPNADQPSAPAVAIGLLTQLAAGSSANRVAMADYRILEALTTYLTLGPQEAMEAAAVELLRVLFQADDLRVHAAAPAAMDQLVAVLRVGSRAARLPAASALEALFAVDAHRASDAALHALHPLVDMLGSGAGAEAAGGAAGGGAVEAEQRAAAAALCQLAQGNVGRVLQACEEGGIPLMATIQRLLEAPDNQPAGSSGGYDKAAAEYRAAGAVDAVMDDEQQANVVASCSAVAPLVSLLEGERHGLHAAASSALFKLAKDRRQCKLDMAAAGVIERIIAIFPSAPLALCSLLAELLRVLTNNSTIAKGAAAARLVGPVFAMLRHAELSPAAQTSALQALVNVLEKPGRLEALDLPPSDAMEPLVPLLLSPSLVVAQLAAGLLAHVLTLEAFHSDGITAAAAAPLVRLLGSELESLRTEALKALELVSAYWPGAIVEAGGIDELSRLVATAPHPMWQMAATVLANVLRAHDKCAAQVPVPVLVRLLMANTEPVQVVALSALLALEREDPARADEMARMGVVDALLELLRCHQVEEAAARLLEAIFNNARVRESQTALRSIAPLASYLLDPNSADPNAKLLAALALGDLFQETSVALKTVDLTGACRALVALMAERASEDLVMVALCGLQNLVASSRANKRAVADAGGFGVLVELLTGGSAEVTSQAANLVRLMLNNHTVQEYATPELVSSMTGVIERELWKTASVNEEVLQAIEGLLATFSRLRFSECATAAIPVLVGAMKVGSEVAQETALNVLWLLRQGWASSKEMARLQSIAMGDTIPVLQLMLRSGPINLYEKAETLLSVLPGSLSVCVKRGANLKASMGATNAYCKLTLSDTPAKVTKVVSATCDPEWKQTFTWPLDAPPRGQNLHISCKNKGTIGTVSYYCLPAAPFMCLTSSLGKATIQIDRVVALGMVSGTYVLQPEGNPATTDSHPPCSEEKGRREKLTCTVEKASSGEATVPPSTRPSEATRVACAAMTHPMLCAAMTHPMLCAAMTHPMLCAAMTHPMLCAAMTHPMLCAAMTHPMLCAAMTHPMLCAAMTHPMLCAAMTHPMLCAAMTHPMLCAAMTHPMLCAAMTHPMLCAAMTHPMLCAAMTHPMLCAAMTHPMLCAAMTHPMLCAAMTHPMLCAAMTHPMLCAAMTHPMLCAAMTHPMLCAAMTHPMLCAAMTHPMLCAAMTHPMLCAAMTHPMLCAAMTHPMLCAAMTHPMLCAAMTHPMLCAAMTHPMLCAAMTHRKWCGGQGGGWAREGGRVHGAIGGQHTHRPALLARQLKYPRSYVLCASPRGGHTQGRTRGLLARALHTRQGGEHTEQGAGAGMNLSHWGAAATARPQGKQRGWRAAGRAAGRAEVGGAHAQLGAAGGSL